jgi:hypothetical protein
MVRKPGASRHLAEIGPLQEFKFSDAQWKRIAVEMGNVENRDQWRPAIEAAAGYLLNARKNPEGHPGYKSPVGDRRAMSQVASSARRLLLALDELSGFARMDLEDAFGIILRRPRSTPADNAANWAYRAEPLRRFKADLSHVADIAPYFAKAGFRAPGSKVPANVDLVRNTAWAGAISWWERATGKQAKAHEKSEASERTPADGVIVRFLQAFTEAIPGEPRPTGDDIRWFLRKYWSKGKKKSWQVSEL